MSFFFLVYLAVLGLSWGTRDLGDLRCSLRHLQLQHANSQLWHVGPNSPEQGSNPSSLHWEGRVLATGPPGKSLFLFLFLSNDYYATRTQKLIKLLRPNYQINGTVSSFWPSVVVQSLCPVRPFVTRWTTAHQASLSFTIFWSLLKLMSIESVMPSTHLIFYCPLLLLPSIIPSIRVFYNETFLCIRWPKYWSFSISPSNEYSGLISFRIDWLDLLAAPGTLKSLLQHHSSNASILRHSAFFTVQLSHPYMTAGKTIALTRQKF